MSPEHEGNLVLKTLMDIKEAIGELKAQQLAANVVLQRHFDDDTNYQQKINDQLEAIHKTQDQQKGAAKAYGAVATAAGVVAGIATGIIRGHFPP
jgi:hypothetical protein